MEDLISLLAALIVLPLIGGGALGLTSCVWQVATAPTTPRWQTYLYFLVTAVVLMKLAGFTWR